MGFRKYLGLGLVAAMCSLSNCGKPIDVSIGQLRYSCGENVKSNGFSICSAVVLDCNDSVVMAHVAPAGGIHALDYDPLDAGNVVEYSIKELRQRGINPKDCKAIIHSGDKKSLDTIIQDLKSAGILIEEFRLSKFPRNIEYNPVTDGLKVIRTGAPFCD